MVRPVDSTGQPGCAPLLAEAVRVLAAAARLSRSTPDGKGDERREPVDWAEFVTLALADAVDNISQSEAVLVGLDVLISHRHDHRPLRLRLDSCVRGLTLDSRSPAKGAVHGMPPMLRPVCGCGCHRPDPAVRPCGAGPQDVERPYFNHSRAAALVVHDVLERRPAHGTTRCPGPEASLKVISWAGI